MKVVFVEWTLDSFRKRGNLTIGKTYTTGEYIMSDAIIKSETNRNYDETFLYEIIDDDGKSGWFPKGMFKKMEEIREDKLNQLGI